jgi:hypothetical protein
MSQSTSRVLRRRSWVASSARSAGAGGQSRSSAEAVAPGSSSRALRCASPTSQASGKRANGTEIDSVKNHSGTVV